jgi:hypothetical protein
VLLLRSDSFPQWQCLRETVSGTFDWSNRSGAYPVVIFVDPVRISPYKSYLARGRALFLQRLIDRYGFHPKCTHTHIHALLLLCLPHPQSSILDSSWLVPSQDLGFWEGSLTFSHSRSAIERNNEQVASTRIWTKQQQSIQRQYRSTAREQPLAVSGSAPSRRTTTTTTTAHDGIFVGPRNGCHGLGRAAASAE